VLESLGHLLVLLVSWQEFGIVVDVAGSALNPAREKIVVCAAITNSNTDDDIVLRKGFHTVA